MLNSAPHIRIHGTFFTKPTIKNNKRPNQLRRLKHDRGNGAVTSCDIEGTYGLPGPAFVMPAMYTVGTAWTILGTRGFASFYLHLRRVRITSHIDFGNPIQNHLVLDTIG